MKALLLAHDLDLRLIRYNLGVANLPSAPTKEPLSPAQDRFRDKIADLVSAGQSPAKIAKAAYPEDKRARKALRNRIRTMLGRDLDMQARIHQRAHAILMAGLGPASAGLSRRAARGRPDAIKLLFEASGYHNPKVKHEHSGDIAIRLDIPRPKQVESGVDSDGEGEIVDAEVVDE